MTVFFDVPHSIGWRGITYQPGLQDIPDDLAKALGYRVAETLVNVETSTTEEISSTAEVVPTAQTSTTEEISSTAEVVPTAQTSTTEEISPTEGRRRRSG
ncbi:MAG TPA: hypothetical protein V6D28_08785 [Leptolyngbyaceae cyanobacterium]|nr:hypothetical protein [Nostocaceae cyanobacterium]